MRAIYSYGAAALIVLLFAGWLATGTFVRGGQGAGNGERPIIALFEEEGGPLSTAIEDAGLAAHHENEEEVDPHLTIAERVAQANGESEAQARSVRTQTFRVEPMAIEAPLRGRTKAKSMVSVVPETSGTVTQVHVEKGQQVAQGDLLCTLDRGTRQAAVDQANAALLQAQAALDQARQQYETNRNLREQGLAPANTALQFESAVASAEAQVAAAQSALDNAKAEWGRTEVVAPVAGVIQDPLATVGSMLGPQAPCATIVELDPMLFVAAIPEARIGLARTGLPAKIKTVTGKELDGTVTFIGQTADEATRTFPVEIEIPNHDGSLRGGITAEATVNLGSAPAHLLPQSVLTLDDEGVLGVRSVVDGIVEFHPVTIIRDTREGVWVTGLPPSIDIITVGQEYVLAGQRVNATNVSEPAADEAARESAQS